MGWHTRLCRLGHIHKVFEQEGDESCGPSCGLMLMERLRGAKLGAEDSYLGMEGYGMSQAVGTYQPDDRPTSGREMARFLKMTFGQVFNYFDPRTPTEVKQGVLANLKRSKPVVMGVMWIGPHGPMGDAGGHWVVVDKVTELMGKTWVCVSDPGDGHVYPCRWDASLVYRPSYSTYGGTLDDYIEIA